MAEMNLDEKGLEAAQAAQLLDMARLADLEADHCNEPFRGVARHKAATLRAGAKALSAAPKQEAGLREALAEHLCAEFDEDFQPARGAHWPEDANDDGKREGGYVKIQPAHVRVRALEAADRILALIAPREALSSPQSSATPTDTAQEEEGQSGLAKGNYIDDSP